MSLLTKYITILSLIFLLLTASVSHGDNTKNNKPSLEDIIITTSKTHLLLFCVLTGSLDTQTLERVHNDVPVTYTFEVELRKDRGPWSFKQILSLSIQHTLAYDTLKKEYRITLSEKNNKTITAKTLARAKELMAEVNGAEIIETDKLIPDSPYNLRLKARLAERELPYNLHKLIPFYSARDIETAWHSVSFRY